MGYKGRRWPRLPLVFTLILQASMALGHPDLVLQIEALDKQIASDPENAELLCKRGDLHRRHQDFEAAANDFRAARATEPNYAPIDFLEGELMLDVGKPELAEHLLSRYLVTRPGHAFAWVLRGKAFIRLGKPEMAANDFTTAILSVD